MKLDYKSRMKFLNHVLVLLLINWWTWLPFHWGHHLGPEIWNSVPITHFHTHEVVHHHQEASESNNSHPPQTVGPCFIMSPGSNRKCQPSSCSALILKTNFDYIFFRVPMMESVKVLASIILHLLSYRPSALTKSDSLFWMEPLPKAQYRKEM